MTTEIIDDSAYLDKAIETVSKVHGYTLDRNDPVLVTASLNHYVLNRAVTEFKKASEENIKKYVTAMEEAKNVSKQASSKIIKEAIQENSILLQNEAKKAAAEIKNSINKENEFINKNNQDILRATTLNRNLSLLFSIIALSAMVATLFIIKA